MAETKEELFKSKFFIAKGSDWNELKDIQQGVTPDKWNDVWVENDLIRMIREQNGIFVNDAFIPLWNKTNGLLFLDGGYGSSKTTYAITRLLVKAMENKYFRCYYGRQKKTEARNLQSNIITEIKRNGWEDLFTYSEQPTGSPQIVCKANGNRFELFGCDDVDSLKGIDNPTDILVDEINQISFEAFGMLFTRLRGSGYEVQLTGAFNNCDVYPDHWLRRFIYVEDIKEVLGESDITNEERVLIEALSKTNIVKHHSCYLDNLFQNPDAYYQKLVVKAGGNSTKIDAYARGDWAVSLSSQPYYKMFKREREVMECNYRPDLALHFSFDENVNPYLPCLIAQLEGNHVYIIDEIAARNPNNRLVWVCDQIVRKFPNHKSGSFIYGDATMDKEDVKLEAGKNLFTMAADYLKKLNPTIRKQSKNPNNKVRQDYVNAIFELNIGMIFVHISPRCRHLIEDLLNCLENPDGKKGGKDKRKETVDGVKGVQRYGHFGDCLDYLLCEAFMMEYLQFQHGGVSYDPEGGQRNIGRSSISQNDVVKEDKKEKDDEEKEDDYGLFDDDDEDYSNWKRPSKNSFY